MLLRASSKCLLNPRRHGPSTTSQGSLFQCSTTLSAAMGSSPRMGQDTSTPHWVSSAGCNQPCDDPVAARHPFSLPCPTGATISATPHHCDPCAPSTEPLLHTAIPSLLEHLQPVARGKEKQTAHSNREDFLKPGLVLAAQARTQVPHVTSSQLLDTWG